MASVAPVVIRSQEPVTHCVRKETSPCRMLSVHENRFNSYLIRFVAFFNFLPLQIVWEHGSISGTLHSFESKIDFLKPALQPTNATATGTTPKSDFRVQNGKTSWRRWNWKLWFGIYIVQGVYMMVRMIQCILMKHLRRPDHMPVHFFWVCFNTAYSFWAYQTFVKWPEYTVGILNEILFRLPVVDSQRKWYELSKQELLAKYLGTSIAATAVVFIVMLSWDDERLQLFYSALPNGMKDHTSFAVTMIFESICIIFYCSTGYFVLYVHVMFFEMVNAQLRAATSALEHRLSSADVLTVDVATAANSELRRLQLLIQLFNQSNAVIVFMFKNICTSISIVGAVFSIRFGAQYPVMGVVCVLTTIDALVFYSLIYEKAFQVLHGMGLMRQKVKVLIQSLHATKASKEHLVKVLHAVPPVGIKVGRFHTMERISTLVFLNFIFCQIVAILVTIQ